MIKIENINNLSIELIKGDCTIEHKSIKDGSIDLILTDLPFGTMKGLNAEPIKSSNDKNYVAGGGYKKGYGWDTIIEPKKIYEIANRILRKNGKMILFCQEPFTTFLITESIPNVPFSYRAIWEKNDFANCLFSKKAMVNYYEDILIFSKNHDQERLHPLRPYFKMVMDFIGLNKKAIVEKIGQKADHTFRTESTQYLLCTEKTYNELIEVFGINKMEGFKSYNEIKAIDENFKKEFASTFNLWEGKKYKSNILKYKKDYDGYHPTQKPVLLLEDLIKTFSNENDLVVDLTMGSGSTGVACINTKRNFIGIEKDENYFNVAKNRIEKIKTEPKRLF
jgi:DNA modification methylase